MSALKRVLLISLCFLICVLFTSCESDALKTSDFKKVDFKKEQKVQLVTNNEVYNILVSISEAGCFAMRFSEEAPKTLDDMKIKITNENCERESTGIKYSTSINNFSSDFFPRIIYAFFNETDFENADFTLNEEENSCFLEKIVSGKKVIFTIQLSLDKTSQNYIIEIR